MSAQKIVLQVSCQSDMTEGRGKMEFHSLWDDAHEAINFINKQSGVGGYKPKGGDWRNEQFPNWDITPVYVYSSIDDYVKMKEANLNLFLT